MNLTTAQFVALFPHVDPVLLIFLNRTMNRYSITSKVRQAAFLAQIGHESAGLTQLVENMNYSAEGLMKTWPGRFKGPDGKPNDVALALHRKPRAIACKVYANRMGNDDEASCDGWKYRARGYIGTTGRDNYRVAGVALNLPLISQPELLEIPENAFYASGFFWFTNGCNELADEGDFRALTKRINGGENGLDDRRARWEHAKKVLA